MGELCELCGTLMDHHDRDGTFDWFGCPNCGFITHKKIEWIRELYIFTGEGKTHE